MNVFYICYEYRYEQIKKKYIRSKFIVSWGVYGGKIRHLLDHYEFSELALFDCLVPKDELEQYFSDLKKYPYKYDKIMKFLIEIESTDLVDNNPDVYLNMFGLRSKI